MYMIHTSLGMQNTEIGWLSGGQAMVLAIRWGIEDDTNKFERVEWVGLAHRQCS